MASALGRTASAIERHRQLGVDVRGMSSAIVVFCGDEKRKPTRVSTFLFADNRDKRHCQHVFFRLLGGFGKSDRSLPSTPVISPIACSVNRGNGSAGWVASVILPQTEHFQPLYVMGRRLCCRNEMGSCTATELKHGYLG